MIRMPLSTKYQNMLELINDTAQFLKSRIKQSPKTAIILGTGLGALAKEIDILDEIPYDQIPHFPISTVEGHSGKWIIGKLGGKDILAMQGRFHYYEGYNMQQVTFPIRVMKALGIETLYVSNAAGGMNDAFHIGDLMLISDDINLFPEHPLRGRNDNRLGPRFPDMSEAYSPRLRTIAQNIALEKGITLREGVYVGTSGPTYETPAE